MFYPENPLDTTTTAPYARTVGIEAEFDTGSMIAQVLHNMGHTAMPGLDEYHAEYSDDYPIHPTYDSTADGGEYIIGGSQGVLFGSPEFVEAIKILEEAALQVRPTMSQNVGLHVHVGFRDFTTDQKYVLLRNYLGFENQILELAAASQMEVRNNGCTVRELEQFHHYAPDFPLAELRNNYLPERPTLNFGYNTVEFRVWNATRVAWRMYLAAGISSAMVEAASRNIHWTPNTDLLTYLDGIASDDVLALAYRQRKYHHALKEAA